jgi:Putative Flp pilus-assembly TadE/G-like
MLQAHRDGVPGSQLGQATLLLVAALGAILLGAFVLGAVARGVGVRSEAQRAADLAAL